MSNKHFKIVVKEAKKNESKSDGERAVDDYDTLIDGLKELGFEPSSNVRNGKIYPYRTRFTATKDGIKYGFTLNEDRTGEYLESLEVVGGSIYTGDPNDKDARVFKSVGDVLDALKQVDGKKSEAMDMSRAKQIVMGDTRHNPKTVAEEIAWSAWVESDGHPKALLRKAARDYYNSGLLVSAERARYLLDTYTDEMRELYKEFTSSVEPAEVASTGEVIPWSSFEDMSSKNEADAEAFIQWITENVARKLVRYASESMKSESLSLKQKELKDMARYGEAEDITTISDAEAKELRKKGIETVGVSHGTYGMNGALLRDKDGNKYVITARSSNLFYFV